MTDWLRATSRLDCRFEDGVLAVLCAGHDGSLAGLYAPNGETIAGFGNTLLAICAEAGLQCHHALTPQDFTQVIGFSPKVPIL